MIEALPELVTIYLHTPVEYFDFLLERMKKRDIGAEDDPDVAEKKITKMEKRLDYAQKELEMFEYISQHMSQNSLSKMFEIIDDEVLYAEVLPYVLEISEVN